MPVQRGPDDRRFVQVEVEVPGTPEQVWQAIATGPGISSWFVPSEVEERVGGTAVSHFGPGDSMDSVGTVTAWEPPSRFVVDTAELGEGQGPVATEWTVQAQSGGTCVVRVVHSWFTSQDDWDGQFEQAEFGWAVFFQILKLMLKHFAGQKCAAFQLMGVAPEPAPAAWAALTSGLGIGGVVRGGEFRSTEDAPLFAGVAEEVGPDEYPGLLARLTEPMPGIIHLFALPMGGQIFLPIRIFLYGEDAASIAAEIEPVWQAWMAEHFPMPAMPAPEAAAAAEA